MRLLERGRELIAAQVVGVVFLIKNPVLLYRGCQLVYSSLEKKFFLCPRSKETKEILVVNLLAFVTAKPRTKARMFYALKFC